MIGFTIRFEDLFRILEKIPLFLVSVAHLQFIDWADGCVGCSSPLCPRWPPVCPVPLDDFAWVGLKDFKPPLFAYIHIVSVSLWKWNT